MDRGLRRNRHCASSRRRRSCPTGILQGGRPTGPMPEGTATACVIHQSCLGSKRFSGARPKRRKIRPPSGFTISATWGLANVYVDSFEQRANLLVNAMRRSIWKIVGHMHLENMLEMIHEAGSEQPRYIKHSIWRNENVGSQREGSFYVGSPSCWQSSLESKSPQSAWLEKICI